MTASIPSEASPVALFVDKLRDHARCRPDALALRAPGGERTFGTLGIRSERLAMRLTENGCKPGDRVVIIGRPSVQWLDVLFGAMFARCAVAPLSTALTMGEQERLIADAHPTIIFAAREFAYQGACPAERTVVLEELELWLTLGPGAGEPQSPRDDDLFSIIYSSGTTGVPKGIAHTARSRADFVAARGRGGLGPGRLAYVSTSLYTNFSFLGIIGPLYHGAGVSVPPRFSPEDFLDAVAREGITDVSLVPVQIRRLLDHPAFNSGSLASLKFTMISGSPVEREVKARLADVWPGTVIDSYGTTETGGIATLDIKSNRGKLDTVGKVMAGVDLVILHEDGSPLPAGGIGEIAARTPLPMDGYFNSAELTERSVWRDGAYRRFVRTGDVGWLGEDGFLRITGRAKDMVISGGLNIYACDIEDALRAHDAVDEAAVIAVPDAQWGERPYAFVVPNADATVTPAELLSWLSTQVARTSQPVGLELIAELPRNDMGKVLKRVLREPFWSHRQSGVA